MTEREPMDIHVRQGGTLALSFFFVYVSAYTGLLSVCGGQSLGWLSLGAGLVGFTSSAFELAKPCVRQEGL